MEFAELLKYSWTLVIPFLLKLLQAYHSSHFGYIKAKKDSLSLLNDVIGDGIKRMKAERKLILEETLSQYYKKDLGYSELIILLKCTSPKKAIHEYLKHRFFLTTCDSVNTFKYHRKPTYILKFGKYFKWEMSIAVYRIFFGYGVFFLLAILLMIVSHSFYANAQHFYQYILFVVASVFSMLFVFTSFFLLNVGTNFWLGRKDLEKVLGRQLQIS